MSKPKRWNKISIITTVILLLVIITLSILLALKTFNSSNTEENAILTSLNKMEASLEANLNGEVSFSDFTLNPENFPNHRIQITQSDFDQGTLRI